MLQSFKCSLRSSACKWQLFYAHLFIKFYVLVFLGISVYVLLNEETFMNSHWLFDVTLCSVLWDYKLSFFIMNTSSSFTFVRWFMYRVICWSCVASCLLVVFYDISTLVGYLIPKHIYTKIYWIYSISKRIICRWQFLTRAPLFVHSKVIWTVVI